MSKTIVFVDDDRDFLDAQEAFFRARGFAVMTANQGDQARALLKEASPDVIVLDLMMERSDSGVTLCHELRKMDHLRDVPVVLLTGVVAATGQRLDRDVEALRKWAGIDAYLDKPVTGRQLLRVVEDLLGQADEKGKKEA